MASREPAFEILIKGRAGLWYRHRQRNKDGRLARSWSLRNAKYIAKRLYDEGKTVKVRRKRFLVPLPAMVLRRKKWTKQRREIRAEAKKWGMSLTSGDRTYNTLRPPKKSDHWTEVESSWADDYWHASWNRMESFEAMLKSNYPLKQVLLHDAGSGNHVHVAGWA